MRKILMFLMLIVSTLLSAQTISETVVIRKAQGGGADSVYINGAWYNIPEDTITISAPASSNSDSLGGFAPATYKDTIFYNGNWLGQGDTLYLGFDINNYKDTIFYNGNWLGQGDTLYLGFDINNYKDTIFYNGNWLGQGDTLNITASDISTTSNINSFINMQNVTNYVDSLSMNFQKRNQVECIGSLYAGQGTVAGCRSVITYTYNDTGYIAVANSSTTAGGIRIYNYNFEQVAVVARNGIEFLTYDDVANRIYATTKSNIIYSYNYIGGNEKSLNYTATTIADVTNLVIARNTVDSTSVFLYGRESTNLWRAYRVTIANATNTIQSTIKTDSIVEAVTLDQLVITPTKDTIFVASSSTGRNRIFQAIYNSGVISHSPINVGASVLYVSNQQAFGTQILGNNLYINWNNTFVKHSIADLTVKTEWVIGGINTFETQMYYLPALNRFACVRKTISDFQHSLVLVDIDNPNKNTLHVINGFSLVGHDATNRLLFVHAVNGTLSVVLIYKY